MAATDLTVSFSIENPLGIIAIVMGLSCSVYLFYDWLKHRREQSYMLLWAMALVLFYVFLIPFLPIGFGKSIVLSEWQDFFSQAVPLVFLGWAFVYWGIRQAKIGKQLLSPPVFLIIWVVLSFIFFVFRFAPTGYEKVLSVVGIVAFFLTIHMLILITLWQWFIQERSKQQAQLNKGIIVIALAVMLSFVRYLVILKGLTKLPAEFWFLTVASFDIGFVLRAVVIILLAIGFVMVHRHYLSKPDI